MVTRPEPPTLLTSLEVVLVVDPEAKEALVNVADVMAPLVEAGLGASTPVRLTCWDGSELGPPSAPLQLTITSPHALRRLLWAPNQLGFARAYVSGDILIGGDLLSALSVLEQVADPEFGPGVVIDGSTRRAIVKAALRLGIVGRPPRPPAEEAKLGGLRHSKARAAKAIAHHYDVGNAFYELILGPSMVYSCGYWPTGPSDSFDLEQAQLAKCDLVVRKLGLTQGEAQSRCRRPTTGGDGCTPSSSGRRPSEGPAMPVRVRHITPLTTTRWSIHWPPRRGVRSGSSGSNNAHCPSVKSCRSSTRRSTATTVQHSRDTP